MSVVFYYMNILNCVYSFFSFCIFGMFLLLFTIVNDTSMNVHIQDFMWTYVSLFLGVYPEVELLGHVVQFSSVAQSCPTLCNLMNRSTPGLPVHHHLPDGVHSNSRPSSQWCHPAISSSVVPFSSCPQSLPASESFPMSQLFTSGGQRTGVSALASFLPKKSLGWSPSDGLVGSPCSPRDSQESSPTPQFKSINSSALSFHYSPTLTSIHDHWKNHSLD